MEYFASNAQLGGVQIMYHNGVSHKTERNDFDGVKRMLRDHSHMTSMTPSQIHATSLYKACTLDDKHMFANSPRTLWAPLTYSRNLPY